MRLLAHLKTQDRPCFGCCLPATRGLLSSPDASTPIPRSSPAFERARKAVSHFIERVRRLMLPLVSAIILILWARGRITEDLPWEILELICDKSDDIAQEDEEARCESADRYFASHPVPRPEDEAERASIDMPADCHMMAWSDIPFEKHQKNKLVLSLSHVCRSWRVRMMGLKRLWREIAFDAEIEPASTHLAALFLTMIEDDDIPIQIYARFPFGNLFNPTIGLLLSKLREQTHRWETFLCWGRLGPYRSYLDLPAPGLRNFSDNHDLSHLYSGSAQLFAGHVPILRSLVTSAFGSWQPTTLTHLETLNLWDCNASLSIGSLLNFLRCTPKLEKINITSPNPPVHDCRPDEVASLLHLKDIKVQNPDFYSIVGHLIIPSVRVVTVYSLYTLGASDLQVGPVFQALHPFFGFASMETSLFNRPVVVVSFDVRTASSGFTFAISFVTEEETSLHISLEWAGGANINEWMAYIKRSISILAGAHFRPGATLQVRMDGCTIDHAPLLCLSAVEYLAIECQDLSKILEVLGCRQAQLLPNLKSLFAPEVELDEKIAKWLLNLLRSRRDLTAVFYIDNCRDVISMLGDHCVLGGRFISLETARL